MGRPKKTTPTDGELRVLRVLWQLGPATVRDIWDALPEDERQSQQAILDLLSVMAAKNYVSVVDERRPQKFKASISEDATYDSIVNDVRRRIFGGSLRDLVNHALRGKKPTAADLDEIKSLVAELGRDRPKEK